MLINWNLWSNVAFDKALSEDKPILLRITASWCHWCDVMDNTSDADPETVELINDNYIPIRIDSDRRPDLNDRYNLGGWPTTAFLNSSGELITGGTYLPPDQFKEAISQIAETWKSDREKIEQAVSTRSPERRGDKKTDPSSAVSKAMIERSVDASMVAYDKRHGGFGAEPKFLHPATLSLLMEEGFTAGRGELLDAAIDSLRKMRTAGIAEGRRFGIYDHEAGGFFRYSAVADWAIPHFEKMLEENARILDIYVTAYQITGDELFIETAHGIMNFFDEWMYDDDQGFFYGSMSPDGEDRYYSLPASERTQMPHPTVDKTLFVNWNAQMISAHLKAGAVLREPFVLEAAHRALDFLLDNCRSDDGGMCHYRDTKKHGEGLLTDQIYMVAALLDAFELSGDRKYLDEAGNIVCYCEENLLNGGAYLDRKSEKEPLGLLKFDIFPLRENAVASIVLTRLFGITDNSTYRDRAMSILQHFTDEFDRYGLLASSYAIAIKRLLSDPIRVRIVGSLQDSRTRELHQATLTTYCPGATIELLDPDANQDRIRQFNYEAGSPHANISKGEKDIARTENKNDVVSKLNELAMS